MPSTMIIFSLRYIDRSSSHSKDQNNQLYLTTLCDDRKEFRWIMVKTSENQLIDIIEK